MTLAQFNKLRTLDRAIVIREQRTSELRVFPLGEVFPGFIERRPGRRKQQRLLQGLVASGRRGKN